MKIISLSKRFGEKTLFHQLNFEFRSGFVYSIFGKNGIGKTTLLNILTNNLNPDSGEVVISPEQDNMIYIMGNSIPFQNVSGMEFLKMTLYFRNTKTKDEDILKWAKKFDLIHSLEHPVFTYSNGMKYKLLIIAAVLARPSILILDEPFIELDLLILEIIKETFLRLKEESLIVFTTHIPALAYKLSDKILYLKKDDLIEVDNRFSNPEEIENYITTLMGGEK